MTFDRKALTKRMVEIDYRHKHRHLPGSLSALPIIMSIYSDFDEANDVFILSKGHSCAALYAVLEAMGKKPNVALVHPERDPENGVTITSGSLGHGLPIAVGIAYAKKLRGEAGKVYVLLGDGECAEGTTWESLLIAERLDLKQNLFVYVDNNGWQGSDRTLYPTMGRLGAIFPVIHCATRKGDGIRMFEAAPEKSVHLVTESDFNGIMEELSAL